MMILTNYWYYITIFVNILSYFSITSLIFFLLFLNMQSNGNLSNLQILLKNYITSFLGFFSFLFLAGMPPFLSFFTKYLIVYFIIDFNFLFFTIIFFILMSFGIYFYTHHLRLFIGNKQNFKLLFFSINQIDKFNYFYMLIIFMLFNLLGGVFLFDIIIFFFNFF